MGMPSRLISAGILLLLLLLLLFAGYEVSLLLLLLLFAGYELLLLLLLLLLQVNKCVLDDAVGLVMYYTKIASSLTHSDALKIRSFLTQTIPDLCYYSR